MPSIYVGVCVTNFATDTNDAINNAIASIHRNVGMRIFPEAIVDDVASARVVRTEEHAIIFIIAIDGRFVVDYTELTRFFTSSFGTDTRVHINRLNDPLDVVRLHEQVLS